MSLIELFLYSKRLYCTLSSLRSNCVFRHDWFYYNITVLILQLLRRHNLHTEAGGGGLESSDQCAKNELAKEC
jgi:hypothetical protein